MDGEGVGARCGQATRQKRLGRLPCSRVSTNGKTATLSILSSFSMFRPLNSQMAVTSVKKSLKYARERNLNNTFTQRLLPRTSPLWWFGGFTLGSALQLQQPQLWADEWYAACALAAAIAALLLARSRPPPHTTAALALAVSLLLGFSTVGWRASHFAMAALNPALQGRDLQVTGTVQAMPQRQDDAVRFRLQVEAALLDAQPVVLPPQLLLGWYAGFAGRSATPAQATNEPDELALALQRQPQDMRAGQRWQMTVRLKAPHGNSNPYGFDYELWLWEQGIQATGYVRAGPHDAPPAQLSDSWRHPVERARQAVKEAIYQRVSDRALAGVLAALVVGDQGAIERADWDIFRTTGVAHLMSISGLHITMFAWLAARLISGLWRRSARRSPVWCLALPASAAGAAGGLALAALYAVFSGWGVPAQRTIWMLAAVVALRLTGRRWPALTVWSLAMAVVVASDPWALMQAGFWLSFVAVGVLFATDSGASKQVKSRAGSRVDLKNQLPPERSVQRRRLQAVRQRVQAVGHHLASGAREQSIVTLALTPLSLLLFNQVSLVGLLANAVAIPWVTLVLTPLAMLGMVWSPLWDVAAWAAEALTLVLRWLALWPWAALELPSAPLWAAVAGVVGGLLLALRLPWRVRLLGVPLLLPVLLWQPARVAPGQFELLAADIGQGNAVLVRTAGHSLLYDTGPRYSGDSDAGQRVLVPLLRALGERVDLLMLSHRDSDHTGGAPAVLASQPQAALYSSIEDRHPLQALRRATRCVAGQHWVWDGVTFDVLHPNASDYGEGGTNPKSNAMSCVLRVSNGLHSALLVGDIEAAQEARLVAQFAPTPSSGAPLKSPLKADVLLVPHHGSKTSSSAVFLDAVQPQLALAQVGFRNRFHHPVPLVVARYTARGIGLVRSDVCGAASWQSTFAQIVQCQRENARRYWHHGVLP